MFDLISVWSLVVGVQRISATKSRFYSATQRGNFGALPGVASSMRAFDRVLDRSGAADLRVKLTDEDATLMGVCAAVLGFAKHAQAGHVVNLLFAGHGSYRGSPDAGLCRENHFMLFDEELTEGDLLVLLKCLPAGVRVNLFFDACRTGSWLVPEGWADDDDTELTRTALHALTRGLEQWSVAADVVIRAKERVLARHHVDHLGVRVFGGCGDLATVNDAMNTAYLLDLLQAAERRAHPDHARWSARTAHRRLVEELTANVRREAGVLALQAGLWWKVIYASATGRRDMDAFPPFDPDDGCDVELLERFLPTYAELGDPRLRRSTGPMFGS